MTETKILLVDGLSLPLAAQVHAQAWRQSHRDFCFPEFVEMHTAERQKEYLRQKQREGCRLYLLWAPSPAGVVAVSPQRGDPRPVCAAANAEQGLGNRIAPLCRRAVRTAGLFVDTGKQSGGQTALSAQRFSGDRPCGEWGQAGPNRTVSLPSLPLAEKRRCRRWRRSRGKR